MTEPNGNPFLIPPPPRAEPVPGSEEAPPAPPHEPDQPMITLPPGLVDSATFKTASPRAAPRPAPAEPARVPASDRVFFPAPPGAPPQPATAAASDTPLDETVRRPDGWRLTLPDGTVPLTGTTFVGRDPAATPAHPRAALLRVVDPAKSVSKTHALFEIDGDGLWVHDLDSTNGVWIAGDGDEETRVPPGERVRLSAGARVELGDFPVRVAGG